VDADEAAELNVGEGTPADQIPKVALGDSGEDREGLEIEPFGPLRLRVN
jgi:hypothetical protein